MSGHQSAFRKIIIAPFIGLIYIYKYVISPILPAGCRHLPTCSSYAVDALKMHGLFRGGSLAANRIMRCHPWGTSGYDPVPRFLIKKYTTGKSLRLCSHSHPCSDRLKKH
ncbi:MAG: membrane protein insertion efficiency factor YidD [Bacteroidales bacterium]|nr:membrane protein insertion efficiency factor YidD [Bacteroidales bacterium]